MIGTHGMDVTAKLEKKPLYVLPHANGTKKNPILR